MPKSKTGTKTTTKSKGPAVLPKPTESEYAEKNERYRAQALAKLGVTEAMLGQSPMISHITRAVGDSAAIMEYLRGSEDERARPFCERADTLQLGELKNVPIEAFCIAVEMPTKKFLGFLMEEVSEQAKLQSMLLVRASHPKVVEATVGSATLFLGKDGVQDRKMLHMAEGLVPVPKTSITVFRNNQIDARQQTVHATLAPVEASVRRISERFIAAPAANAPVEVLPEPEGEDDEDNAGEEE